MALSISIIEETTKNWNANETGLIKVFITLPHLAH